MSDNRSPIPAGLRRRVLLEAGHRCAIPTCKYPKVDVHHIVPWTRCLEHRFENLIALCPNCHRRADRGEIDRKSLLLYKTRLMALFGPELLMSGEPEGKARIWISSSFDQYSTAVLSVSSGEQNYEVEVEYPQFNADKEVELNRIVRELVERAMQDLIAAAEDPARLSTLRYWVVGSFNIALRTPLAVSLRFSFSSYTGGAHGNNWTEVINYRADQGVVLGIQDFFAVPDLGIKMLSEYSISSLLGSTEFRRDEAHVKRGAAPDPDNFVNFNLSTEGVSIVFDEYQVGCYAAGKSEVLVPYAALRPMVSDFLDTLIENYGGVEA